MTLGLLLIYRLGSYVVLPGIDPVILEDLTPQGGSAGLTGLIDLFAGVPFREPLSSPWVLCHTSLLRLWCN